jgi:intein/homing endonuclease
MLNETVGWENGEEVPLHYFETELPLKGTRIVIEFPQEVTGDLAEEIGIHLSDGYMDRRFVEYSGHEEDDSAYLLYWVRPLLREVWSIQQVKYKEADGKCIKLRINSRQLVVFKERVLGLPRGKKEGIKIPECVLKRRDLVLRVLNGLFDGDGSLSFKSKDGLGHTYPVISYASISDPLLRQIQELLRRLGFTLPNKLYDKKDGTLILSINGDRNYERWMRLIGFNNPKHLTKVVVYERDGIMPPHTGLRERVKLIRGDVKLSAIYPVDKLRMNKGRIVEKKILEKLVEGENYIGELGQLTQFHRECVADALRRMAKMGLVECVRYKRGCKKYYELTQWGVNKLNREEAIVKRLREEFHLAV